ncbi:hypothetical protein CANCADRAFT_33016 [Tortispora caseinolytica NRRL Y-17796]|uniref:CDP-diacylglycerol--serine O-phosphatidyltransferase n=1 Tax=Tortispora caseinolytica NRRL Y-17796 TaxID=767744 RepID=A0A1E4T9I1_9ASCO|nr:hypothetical protein CANCADRAFT_33016 [Tortispora caseinolytica NRRL Y-17796]
MPNETNRPPEGGRIQRVHVTKTMAPKTPEKERIARGKSVQRKAEEAQLRLLTTDRRAFNMIRLLHLADCITILNGTCGFLSIINCMKYCLGDSRDFHYLYIAMTLCPIGLFFDFMDGRVARWRNKSSVMGQELDSLADLISFGVAPASCAFSYGFRSDFDLLILLYFVMCGLTRLARFNVSAAHIPKDKFGKSRYFEGTPIPTTMSLLLLIAYWVYTGRTLDAIPGGVWFAGTRFEVHPAVSLFFVSGCAMISRRLRVPKP